MALITYEDKQTLNENPAIPDINKCKASDLNEIKQVVNGNYNETKNDLYFKSGDTISIGATSGYALAHLNGFVTNSTKDLHLSLVVPKNLENISSITCTEAKLVARGILGYLNSDNTFHDYINDADYTIQVSKVSNYVIAIKIIKSSAFTNSTNNTPIVLSGKIGLSFS